MSQHFVAIGPNKRRVGVVASNYTEFMKKCRRKLDIKVPEEDIYITLDDDTEVDSEYFEILQNGTELHLKTKNAENHSYSLNQLANFLHKCLLNQPKIHDKVAEFLEDPEQTPVVLGLLTRVAEASYAPSEADDLNWFKGLATKFKTKESVMRNSAETRMRSYLDQAKKMLLVGDSFTSHKNAIDFFKEKLVKAKYNSDYFDRLAPASDRLCEKNGLFRCEGLYNKLECEGIHAINPYNSREARIVFSTWNLDHVVEKSRSILPILKDALQGPRSSEVNLLYFYDLLFVHRSIQNGTARGNLKLVHIACHDKKPHENKCESSHVYVSNCEDDSDYGRKRKNYSDVTDGIIQQLCPYVGMTTRQRLKNYGVTVCSSLLDISSVNKWSSANLNAKRKSTSTHPHFQKHKRRRV